MARKQNSEEEKGGYAVGRRLVELAARVFGVVPVLKLADGIALDLVAYTPRTPTTKDALRKDIGSARELGYATSFEERVGGVDGVPAPLISGDIVVGGLTVAIPTSRAPEDGFDAIGSLVRKRAHELSSALTAMGVKHT